MAQVKVVTDSTSYLPADLIASSGLEVVSLWINYPSGESQLESDIQDLGAYWRELADLTELPTTSQPAPGAFEECFEPLVAAGQDVVAVLISAGISGTVGSAQTAADALKERYPDRKIIIPVNKEHNAFTFRINPSVAEVYFNNFSLIKTPDGLIGKHPVMEGNTFVYGK